jgi:hypothetical protein
LQEIGDEAFAGTELRSIFLPIRVHELGQSCFSEYTNLWLVSFEMANPKRLPGIRIFAKAFRSSGPRWIELPPRIFALGDRCFHSCTSLFRVQSAVELSDIDIGNESFANSGIGDFHVVESAPSECSLLHPSLTAGTFLPASTFESSSLSRIVIDAVCSSIRLSCFERCLHLRDVFFQPISRSRRIESRDFQDAVFVLFIFLKVLNILAHICSLDVLV